MLANPRKNNQKLREEKRKRDKILFLAGLFESYE
jgi:hypothetical protein